MEMDGNYYLIKLVKKHPVLWDKSCQENRDSDVRNDAWKQIAASIGVEMSWIRSRWYNLRERFVKELKLSYSEKQESKFRYFNEMMFLLKHVEFRKKPDDKFDSFVEQLPHKNKPVQKEKTPEFEITKKEIEESEIDIDPNLVFVEFDSESGAHLKEQEKDTDNSRDNIYVQESCDSSAPDMCNDNIEKIIEIQQLNFVPEYEETSSTSAKLHSNKLQTEPRCEDTIFGELVTAMLKKMDENKKKNAKKEIINILLS